MSDLPGFASAQATYDAAEPDNTDAEADTPPHAPAAGGIATTAPTTADRNRP